MKDDNRFEPLLDESAFDANLNIRILRLAALLSTIFQRSTLRAEGVSVQEHRILISIARHGASHLRDIARKASMDASHASRTMARMQKRGWLWRGPDPGDKRLLVYGMTEKGREKFLSVYPHADALARDFAAIYSADDAKKLIRMLDAALEHARALLNETENQD